MKAWEMNDLYISDKLIEESAAHKQAAVDGENSGLAHFQVSPAQGKFLHLMAKMAGAGRILEIGTFMGYSAIWLGMALPENGELVCLEFDEEFAATARKNIELAGLSDKVKVLHGDAVELLAKMVSDGVAPFDMIFIDADKTAYPAYLELALQLSRAGTVIFGDNVVRGGELQNLDNTDPKLQGVRQFIEDLKSSGKLESTALQTVGAKGYDGFAISIVK